MVIDKNCFQIIKIHTKTVKLISGKESNYCTHIRHLHIGSFQFLILAFKCPRFIFLHVISMV